MAAIQDAKLRTDKGANFTAIHAGPYADLDKYQLEIPALKRKVNGKLFIKDFLGLSGMEISMNKVPAGIGMPFTHQHKENEEAYIFIKGRGQMQVDGQTFDVEEGSVVRVATKGSRCFRNNSAEDLEFICIQAKENSLNASTIEDGIKGESAPVWPD